VTALKQAFFNILSALVENTDNGRSAPRRLAEIDIATGARADRVEVRFTVRGPDRCAISPELLAGLEATDLLAVKADHQLAQAHSIIVRQHQGRIVTRPAPDHTLTVLVDLPQNEPAARRLGSAASATQRAG
jgi:hypothetical protein